ncbi:MAG: lipopolysaccharide biosynthesis protein [Planctomycetaceae bacterium]
MQKLRAQIRSIATSSILRNTGWQYASNIAGALLAFVYSLMLGRALGVEKYGLISLSLGFAGLIFNLVELRLHEWVIRYLTEFWEAGDYRRAIATIRLSLIADVVTGLIAVVSVFALSPIAAVLFNELRTERAQTLIWLAGMVSFSGNVGNATAIGVLRVLKSFRALALIKIGGHLLKLAATAIVLLLVNIGVSRAVLGVSVATGLVTTIVLAAVAVRELRRSLPFKVKNSRISLLQPRLPEMARFAGNIYGVSLAAIPTRDLDVNFLGVYSSAAVVGTYRVARDFMAAMWQVSDPMLFVIYPELSRLWARRDLQALQRLLWSSFFGLAAVAVLLCGAAFFTVPSIITMSMGSDFAEAGLYFRWMLIGLVVWMPLLWVNPLLMASGRADLFFRATVVASVATLACDVYLIPKWGGTGASFAYAVSHIAAPLTSLWLARANGIFRQLRGCDHSSLH